MEYSDLLSAHLKYGTTSNDIILGKGFEEILPNVVIAPWWGHEMFQNNNFRLEQVNDILFNIYSDDVSFSYLELKRIGAPAVMEFILSLGVTKCKNLIFLGSAGSLDENLKIGDIVIPEYSICGDGASRYLNDNLEDEFLKKEYPTKEFQDNLLEVLNNKNTKYHYVPNFSCDTIFAQFYHIDKILDMGAKTIEMETANLFKCASIMNINTVAIFCISDNTVIKKSLYSGRSEEENNYRHKVRYEILPDVVIDLFK